MNDGVSLSIELVDVVGDIEGGRLPSALKRLKQRLVAFPAEIDSLFLRGFLAHVSGQSTLASNLRLLAVAPGNAAAAANAAGVLVEQGMLVRAQGLLRRALALDPGFPPAHANLGLCLLRDGKPSLAIGVLTRTLQLGPPDPMTLLNFGAALDGAGRKAEAQAAYRVALVIAPDFARAIYNEAVLAQGRGEVEAAIGLFRRTLAIMPGEARVHGHLIFALTYRADFGNRRRAAEVARWAARHARLDPPPMPPAPLATLAGRRLRIGYLSSDFRTHPVARNVEGLIRCHDRSAFEVALYSATPETDAATERLKHLADLWRDLARSDDAAIARQIRQDRTDILVILGAHTGDNRPLVAAYRPAPVIVSAHDLGTTGMAEIGYWLTDATLHPPDTPERFVETLVRLPCFYLHVPPEAPPVRPRAAGRDATIFISANNPAKLGPETVALWSRVLAAVPGAELVLKFVDAFADPSTQRLFEDRFAAHEISRDRLVFASGARESANHLARIGDADIALDPFPFNGSTTTFEALWMGLPVVSLAGSCFAGRVGASLLTAAGLPELLAADGDDYVRIAAALAADRPRLAALRAELRERVAASPICRPEDYARSVETAYRQMWDESCRSGPSA